MGNKNRTGNRFLDSLDDITRDDIILTPRDDLFTGTVNMTDESLEEFPLTEIIKKAKGNYLQITSINLNENEFEILPAEIYQFINLKTLELNENTISEIPEGIDKLQDLEELQLYANDICVLPNSFSKLTSLTCLDLSANSFIEFPNIFELKTLKTLALQDNQIKEIPKEIKFLQNLKTIELNENGIKNLPIEFFELKNLKKIDLSKNLIEEIPKEISNLTKLEELDLPENKIKIIPDSFGNLNKLTECDISQNYIKELPSTLSDLKELKYFKVDSLNEKLTTPPTFIVKKGEQSILSYLKQIQEHKAQEYSRLPILILGDGGVGKTCLLKTLKEGIDKDMKFEVTHGVNISDLKINGKNGETIFTTFDFGGQKVFHSLHPFFMVKKSIFIITYNLRYGPLNVEYWLHSVKTRSPKSSIVIVATHSDSVDEDSFPFHLKMKFPQIKDILKVSNLNGDGIDYLMKRIYEISQDYDDIRYRVPLNYLRLVDITKELSSKIPYCDLNYLKDKSNIQDYFEFERAVKILHSWGILMHFKKKGKFLQNLIILNPQWLSDITTKIITVKKHDEYISNGIIETKTLHQLWNKICPNESDRKALINLMIDCEFIYQIGIRNYLIPSMINSFPSEDLNLKKEITEGSTTLKRFYHFEFLPMDFFTRFLVRINKFSNMIGVWKSGVLIKANEEKSLINIENIDKKDMISIEVNGDYPLNLLSIISNVIETLLKEYEGIEFSIEISCPNCLILHENGVFKVKEIKSMIFKNQNKIECSKCKQFSNIEEIYENHPRNEIIHRILNSKSSNENITPTKREFIHRQYLSKIQKQFQKETPLLFPYLTEDNKILVYNICEHSGYWHFNENVKYILNEDKKNELFFKDEFIEFQKYLSMLNQILEKIPPLNVPKNQNWNDMLENSKKIETYVPNDMKFRKNDMKKRELSFFEIIIQSNSNVKKLNLVKIPTLLYKVFLCEEHRKYFEDTVQEGNDMELSENLITLKKKLGNGGFGNVYQGLLFNVDVAVKMIDLSSGLLDETIDKQEYKSTMKEVEILRKLDHQNIVLYYGAYLSDSNSVCIVMEYVGNGTLRTIIKKLKKSNEKIYKKELKKKLIIGIANGMKYIHDKNIIHQDLKPENILIGFDEKPKVADFGLSKLFDENCEKMITGTPQYTAPEILNGEPATKQSDIYSFGILLFELYSESKAYENIKNHFQIWKMVRNGERPSLKGSDEAIPIEIMKIVQKCWSPTVKVRPTFEEIANLFRNM
eukprot:gene888-9799_t